MARWVFVSVLEAVHPLPEVALKGDAAAASDVATLIYTITGFAILGLFVALLRVNARKWNVAMLAVICALLVVSGVVEPWV